MSSRYLNTVQNHPDSKHGTWQVLHINTKDRDTPTATTSTNCKITIPPMRNVSRVLPLSSEFPNNQYIVNSTNNKLYWSHYNASAVATVTGTIILSSGNHTASSLVTEIQTAFNTSPGANELLVSYSNQTEAFTFGAGSGASDGDTLTFPFSTNPAGITAPCNKLLGLSVADHVHTNAATDTNITSDIPCELNGPAYVTVDIKELNNDTDVSNTRCFMKLRLTSAPDTYIFDEFASSGITFQSPIPSISRLTVVVRNPDGTTYDMRGGDWSFSLAFLS